MKHLIVVAGLILAALAGAAIVLRTPAPEIDRPSVAACPSQPPQLHSAAMPETTDLRDMVAGLLVTGFAGDHVKDNAFVEFLDFARAYPPAGIIYLKRNVRRSAEVAALNDKLWQVLDRPFIMIDEEGGVVSRLSDLPRFPAVPAARDVARASSPSEARALYSELAEALDRLGFNVNLGPVVDLGRNEANPVIAGYGRAYSAAPEVVLDYARAFSHAHAEAGILTALKHFPGHGSSDADTHFSSADVTSSWQVDELVPFIGLVEEDLAPMVMTSHVTLASEHFGQPAAEIATFSANIVDYVRSGLCHDGLVISDDLSMEAVAEGYSLADRLEKAIRAGHDLLIIAAPRWNGTRQFARAVEKVAQRAAADPELAAMVDSAHRRVAHFKQMHLSSR